MGGVAKPNDTSFSISIHALREEGDKETLAVIHVGVPFLSTPSARRATFVTSALNTASSDFYPRPPRGGRPRVVLIINQLIIISIHALREEGDTAL